MNAAVTNHQDTGRTNGQSYTYTVSAVNANGEGSESSSASATPSTTPGTPTSLSAVKGDTIVDLSWTAPVDTGGSALINYTIYKDTVFLINVTAGTTIYQDTGLTNGETWYYVIVAVNGEGESAYSSEVSAINAPPRLKVLGL